MDSTISRDRLIKNVSQSLIEVEKFKYQMERLILVDHQKNDMDEGELYCIQFILSNLIQEINSLEDGLKKYRKKNFIKKG